MRLCFIVEEQYRDQVMPMSVAQQLRDWGHHVDVLEPLESITCLSDLHRHGDSAHQAYVLKTVSDGPGLSLLEAAAAVGIATINNARAIRLVRDKAVAAAYARRHGIAFPVTYFVAHPALLKKIPLDDYPLVVKPSNGSSCRDVFLVEHPAQLDALGLGLPGDRFYLAQTYIENVGADLKLYCTGSDIFAVLKPSPLHPDAGVTQQLVPLEPEVEAIARRVGEAFGLDIFGVDVVQTRDGWVALDINDFPSFGMVPDAARLMAETIQRIAEQAARERQLSMIRHQRLGRDHPRTLVGAPPLANRRPTGGDR
ncbi:MAG: ATP-grasp domain-containing protein [Gaiellales bacterium]